MASFQSDELKGILSNPDPTDPGQESNAGFCMLATAERLMHTGHYRRGFLARRPLDDQNVDYPYFGVFPEGLIEEEKSNVENMKKYSMLVLMELVDDESTRGVLRLLALREKSEAACRSKVKIRVEEGSIHEDTLLDTAAFIMTEGRQEHFLITSGFRVIYHITELRKEE